jgi:peptidyl-prolyl cis-trans isomerase A (cyclophilin A)
MPTTKLKTLAGPVLAACLLLGGCSQAPPPAPAKKVAPASAPDVYRVKFETSKGDFEVEVTKAWAPRGASHFYDLVTSGYYDGDRFFRVVRNFIVQFGISGDPAKNRMWGQTAIPDDPASQSNRKGTITYARLGPHSRTTQVFINLKDNGKALDKEGFAPFGKVVSGMDVVESLYGFYGEVAPRGSGPDPNLIQVQGNAYLESRFPRLDYVRKASLVPAF